MKRSYCAVLLLFASLSWSDTLKFKNGSTLIGTYAGGSDRDIAFRVGASVQHYDVNDVASLSFDSGSGNSQPPDSPSFANRDSRDRDRDGDRDRNKDRDDDRPPQSSNPTYRSFSNSLTLPVGTRLVVRTIDAIDSDKNRVGDKFQATLDQSLYVNDAVVAPKGADVYGRLEEVKEAGHIEGKAQLKLALTGIVINGQTVPITTGDYELSGKSRGTNTAQKVGGGAALGAVIGAIAGGGKGAAIGAGVGAGAGTAVQVMTKGEQVHVPSETLLEFTLDQSVTVSRAQ
jgi:hypothetical protein